MKFSNENERSEKKMYESRIYKLSPQEVIKEKPKHHADRLNLKPLLRIDFKDDFEEMLTIFPEEDTVIAMISTLEDSPAEIQIIAKIILDLHKKIDDMYED